MNRFEKGKAGKKEKLLEKRGAPTRLTGKSDTLTREGEEGDGRVAIYLNNH